MRAIGVAGLLTGMLFAGVLPANAQAQSAETLEIVITAEVPTRCGFAESSRSAELTGDIEARHTATVRLGLDCNAPYAITARSLNGQLAHDDQADDGSGYAFAKDYGLTVALETDRGRVQSQRCASPSLVSGAAGCALSGAGGLTSGDGVSIGRDAVVTIDWSDQSELGSRLAAGKYSDTIILEIGARA